MQGSSHHQQRSLAVEVEATKDLTVILGRTLSLGHMLGIQAAGKEVHDDKRSGNEQYKIENFQGNSGDSRLCTSMRTSLGSALDLSC